MTRDHIGRKMFNGAVRNDRVKKDRWLGDIGLLQVCL